MCGRYYISNPDDIYRKYPISRKEYVKIKPNYNISPGSDLPIILKDRNGFHVRLVRWGLIPSWAKDPRIGYKMINARMETLAKKPSWKKPLISQRAIIPANGFYEWKKDGKSKIPFVIKDSKADLLSFAGLWDIWKDNKGNIIPSFTIITAPADKNISPIHNRMPIILTKRGEEAWLNPKNKDPNFLDYVLRNDALHSLETYRVSDDVNKPINNSPELLKPFA